MRYTEEEILFLKENYPKLSKKEILKKINRTWVSIQKKMFLLNIKRLVYESKNNNKFKKLLDNNVESFYWLGFLIADGHFNKNKFITINLSKKDINHINKFRKFLGINESEKTLISISDQITFEELRCRFNIHSNKTYFPCDLSYVEKYNEFFFSFIIGFIDGDGSINKKGNIRIKCHNSWQNNIEKMIKFLTNNNYKKPKINKEGLVVGHISSIEIVKRIKHKIDELKLPVLKRKWDLIPMNKLSKNEKSLKIKKDCFQLLEENKSITEIIKKTGYSQSQIYKQKKEFQKERPLKRGNLKEK
jgi:hypothetical protein